MHAIVHIGMPKAGSTSIQGAIWRNSDALLEQGIRTFRASTGPQDRALSTRFRPDQKKLVPIMRRWFRTMDEAQDWSQRCWEELEQMVRTERPPLTLLSSEHFFNLPWPGKFLEALRELFSEITVVAYIRDPADFYKSEIDQKIRGGVRLHDLDTPLSYVYPSATQARKYLRLLGRENMIVRNFDRKNLSGGDVVTDFFEVVGRIAGRPISVPRMPPRANESLCAAATVWLLTQNELFQRFTQGNDSETLKLRFDMIDRLRKAESLADLPRLGLTDPLFADLIRYNAREACTWYNETFFADQVPFATGTKPSPLPDDEEIRSRMREWLFGYLTPEALDQVLREVVPLAAEELEKV